MLKFCIQPMEHLFYFDTFSVTCPKTWFLMAFAILGVEMAAILVGSFANLLLQLRGVPQNLCDMPFKEGFLLKLSLRMLKFSIRLPL